MREVRLSPEDEYEIRENPGGLTKEGCMVKIFLWSNSNNPIVLMKYLAMYKLCKKWEKSGELDDGSVILARSTRTNNNGVTKTFLWKEKIGSKDQNNNVIIADSVDNLRKFVDEKLTNLRFLTNKGGP